MVGNAADDHYIWLPGNIWAVYVQAGGPTGDLGLPVADVDRTADSVVATFEHGTITHTYGIGAAIEAILENSEPFDTDICEPARRGSDSAGS